MSQNQSNRGSRVRSATVYVVRLAIGLMFVASAVPKLRHPYVFLADVYGYEILGPLAARAVAATVPVLELTVGCLLLGGVLTGGALLTAAVLSGTFAVAQASAIYRGLEIDCGCFGSLSGDHTVGAWTLARVSAALLACAVGLWAWGRGPGIGPAPSRELTSDDVVPGVEPAGVPR